MRILGIESSCDETSAALLDADARILGHVILSQDVHQLYGGVVPELAARAHLQVIDRVVDEALAGAGAGIGDVDAVAVTRGPGLIGALLVGVAWAKAFAFGRGIPLVGVHHLEAHLFAPSLEDPRAVPPFVALLVSGGHTLLLHVPEWGVYHRLGETRDDAAGEAFDKVARLMGLPYPGGPSIEASARTGSAEAFSFPRPMMRRSSEHGDDDYFDFSFSGLKTAVSEAVESLRGAGRLDAAATSDLASSFQEAVVDVLAGKTLRAIRATGTPRVLLAGGVSANRRLRDRLEEELSRIPGGVLLRASPRLSLDNAAMIARAGAFRIERDGPDPLDVTAHASLPFPGLRELEPGLTPLRPLPPPAAALRHP